MNDQVLTVIPYFRRFLPLLIFISSLNAQVYYNYHNYTQDFKYNLTPLPFASEYTSSSTCVPLRDVIYHNYTDIKNNRAPYNNVFPENFCYSYITYNITREDFFDIINKNLSKHLFTQTLIETIRTS